MGLRATMTRATWAALLLAAVIASDHATAQVVSVSNLAPVVSGAAESSHVLKASGGTLLSLYVTTSASGYVMTFDATSAPADGAVTPKNCVYVGGPGTVALNWMPAPGPGEKYTNGIVATFSSTGCFSKTASATAFFHGTVQ